MKNEHLIPVAIKDIAEKINSPILKKFDKDYHAQRLETIKDYCEIVLDKYSRNKK